MMCCLELIVVSGRRGLVGGRGEEVADYRVSSIERGKKEAEAEAGFWLLIM